MTQLWWYTLPTCTKVGNVKILHQISRPICGKFILEAMSLTNVRVVGL